MSSQEAATTVRFIIVGVSAAALQAGLTYLLLHRGLRAGLAVIVAGGTAFVCAYLAQKFWTFASEQSHYQALPRYFATQLFCALLAALTGEVSAQLMHWPDGVTAILATGVASVTSYFLSSRWVFR